MNGTSLTTAFVPLPGGGTAVYNASGLAYYRHADWLGSSRLTSTSSRGLDSSTAYAPFGEQYAASGTADPSFTGQNSDTVPSLYDFTFRRLSPSQGRWVSPDPSGMAAVDPTNPQSMNRYAYVANNPLSYIDPTGLNLVSCFLFGIGCDDGGGGGGAGAGGGGGPDPCGGNYDTCVSVYGGDPNSCSMTDPMCQWACGSASGGGVPNVPNGGTFGGGGRAPNNGPTVSHCLGVAGRKNGVALALDTASLGVDAFGPEAQYAKLGIGLTLSTASMINSAANQDMTGTGLGMASYLKAPTELAATSAGWGWAKWVPFAGAAMDVASAYHDGSQAFSDYSSCMAGH